MRSFNRMLLSAALAGGVALGIGAAQAQTMVGGAQMMADKKIPENAPKANNLTTLVSAVKEAGLVDTLNGAGPFTVFAPTDAAFKKLPAGTIDNLMKPENKAKLKSILTYHVVPGKLTAADLKAEATKMGGKANLKTVEGETLTVREDNGKWVVLDASGGGATIETADVMQANGVVHVVDSVLMPKM